MATIGVVLGTGIVTLLFMVWAQARGIGSSPALKRDGGLCDIDAGCGPVCLSVVSQLLEKPGTIGEFNRLAGASETGVTSLADLKEAIVRWGFFSEGVHVPPDAPLSPGLPLVLHLHASHFAVGIPVDGGKLVLVDPPRPPALKSRRDLERVWAGDALIVGATQEEIRRHVKHR